MDGPCGFSADGRSLACAAARELVVQKTATRQQLAKAGLPEHLLLQPPTFDPTGQHVAVVLCCKLGAYVTDAQHVPGAIPRPRLTSYQPDGQACLVLLQVRGPVLCRLATQTHCLTQFSDHRWRPHTTCT